MSDPAQPEPQALDPYAALRLSGFRLFLLGSAIGVAGSQIVSVALGWELYNRTHEARVLGWIGLVRVLPVILLSLPAGHVADRFDRKSVMLISQFLSALCSLWLAYLSFHEGSIWLMYLCLLLRSISATFGMPARSSLLPQVVPLDVLSNAVTWNSNFFQIALVVGPVLGGMILNISVWQAYVMDAACLLVAFFATLFIQHRPNEVSREPASLQSLGAGIRFVWRSKVILAALTLDLLAVLLGGATALLPIFAEKLHVGATGLGWLRAAPALGAVAMALVLAHLPPMKRAGTMLLFAVAGFGISMIIFGLSESFWLCLAMLFVSGALDNISVVVRHTLVQFLAPDSMRGRISAVNSMFIGASNQLGEYESGETAHWFGPVMSVVGGGIGTVLVVLGVAAIFPQLRGVGRLDELKPEPNPEESDVVAAK
jgi:MFS family permease